jgi:hypothetical protein
MNPSGFPDHFGLAGRDEPTEMQLLMGIPTDIAAGESGGRDSYTGGPGKIQALLLRAAPSTRRVTARRRASACHANWAGVWLDRLCDWLRSARWPGAK